MAEPTPEYLKEASRFLENHPESNAALHRLALGGTGLSEQGQQEIVNRKAPHLIFHPAISQIVGSTPKNGHAQAVAKIHEQESAGPTHENEEVDSYLKNAGRLSAHHNRKGLRR